MQVFEKIEPESKRGDILLEAYKIINGERQDQYGKPEDNFKIIADLWTVYLGSLLKEPINTMDVALMMALMKIGRISSGSAKRDSFVDAAGYIGLASNMEM